MAEPKVIEEQLVAAWEGDPPELSEAQWQGLLEQHQRLGRMLSASEAVEIIRQRCQPA